MANLNKDDVKSGRVIPQPGDTVDGFAYVKGPPTANTSYRALTGTDYLSSIDPQRQAIVKNILMGHTPIPTGFLARDPYWKQIYSDVMMAEPGFDATKWGARAKLQSDFGNGKARQQINALNMGIHHAAGMMDAYDNLNNWNTWPIVNSVANTVEEGFNPRIQAAKSAANLNSDALAAETAAIFEGKAPAVEEIKGYKADYGSDKGPAASNAALGKFANLAHDRLSTLQQQWRDVMGPVVGDYPIISPDTQNAWKKLTSRYDTATGELLPPAPQQKKPSPQPARPATARQSAPRQAPTNAGWSIQRVN